jgi:hypothetical protein
MLKWWWRQRCLSHTTVCRLIYHEKSTLCKILCDWRTQISDHRPVEEVSVLPHKQYAWIVINSVSRRKYLWQMKSDSINRWCRLKLKHWLWQRVRWCSVRYAIVQNLTLTRWYRNDCIAHHHQLRSKSTMTDPGTGRRQGNRKRIDHEMSTLLRISTRK